MGRFDDRTVLVTGAGGGMGRSHVAAFHAEGANVVVADVDGERGAAIAAGLGGRGASVRLDVRDERQWTEAVEAAERHFGPVSVLVNNAGVQQAPATLEELDLATWQRAFDINLTGQLLGIRAVAPSMRRAGGGAIVNVGSTMAYGGTAAFGAYVASKWAVRGLTRTAALELGRDRIRVNAVHPGVVETPLITEPNAPGAAPISDAYSPAPFAVPRLARPDEVARLVLFLASEDAAFATGSDVVLDGGLLLGPALAAEPVAA